MHLRYNHIMIPILIPNNNTLENANTFLSIIWLSLIKRVLRFLLKESIFFCQNKVIFSFICEYILITIPKLIRNNSTLEHANTFLSIIWLSLIKRDLRFLYKESIFFCQKKEVFLICLRHIHIMIQILIPNNITLTNANTFLNIKWLSLIERVLHFLFKESTFLCQNRCNFSHAFAI